MNVITGSPVEHKLWGEGTVVSFDGGVIVVDFPKAGTKKFPYPECFEKHLRFANDEMQSAAELEGAEKKAQAKEILAAETAAFLKNVNAVRKAAEMKHENQEDMRSFIGKYGGDHLYANYRYVRKQLSKFGNLKKIMSKDYLTNHQYLIGSLEEINCTETPEEILHFYRHTISDGYGDYALMLEINNGLYGSGDFFSKEARKRFILAMASFSPVESEGYDGMDEEVFENDWNCQIGRCCQMAGDMCLKKKDYEGAFKYYSKESDVFGVGTPHLGDLYLKGLGTKKNVGKALACYYKEDFASERYTCNSPSDSSARKHVCPKDIFKIADAASEELKDDYLFCYYFAKMLKGGYGTAVDLQRAEEFALQAGILEDSAEFDYDEIGSGTGSAESLLEKIADEEARRKCLDEEMSRKLKMDVYKELPKLKITNMSFEEKGRKITFVFYPRDKYEIKAYYCPETETYFRGNDFTLNECAKKVFQEAFEEFDYSDLIEDAEKLQNGFQLAEDSEYETKIYWRNTDKLVTDRDFFSNGFVYQFLVQTGKGGYELQENTLFDCELIREILMFGIRKMTYAGILYEAAKGKDRYLELGIKRVARTATDEELEELSNLDGIKRTDFIILPN